MNNIITELDLTDEIVTAWLKARADRYGIPGLRLTATYDPSVGPVGRFIAAVDAANGWGCGETLDLAVENLRRSMKSKEQMAEELRVKAAKLLAEADALVPAGAQVVEAPKEPAQTVPEVDNE